MAAVSSRAMAAQGKSGLDLGAVPERHIQTRRRLLAARRENRGVGTARSQRGVAFSHGGCDLPTAAGTGAGSEYPHCEFTAKSGLYSAAESPAGLFTNILQLPVQ